MSKIQLFSFIISCFSSLVKEVKYNRFISDFWTVELLKDGISLKLQIFDDSILPVINMKSQSIITYDEVFPYIIGLFGLNNETQTFSTAHGGSNGQISRVALKVN